MLITSNKFSKKRTIVLVRMAGRDGGEEKEQSFTLAVKGRVFFLSRIVLARFDVVEAPAWATAYYIVYARIVTLWRELYVHMKYLLILAPTAIMYKNTNPNEINCFLKVFSGDVY